MLLVVLDKMLLHRLTFEVLHSGPPVRARAASIAASGDVSGRRSARDPWRRRRARPWKRAQVETVSGRGVGVRSPSLSLACCDQVVEKLESFVAGALVCGVVRVDQRGAEHDLEVTRMKVGELQVGPPVGVQRFEGAVDTVNGCAQVAGEELETLYGDGGEHPGLVAEVVGGGGVGDADPAGRIPQAEMLCSHFG